MPTSAALRAAEVESFGFRDTLNILGREFHALVSYDYDHAAVRSDEEPISLQSLELVAFRADGMVHQVGITASAPLLIDAGELPEDEYERLLFAAHVAWMRS